MAEIPEDVGTDVARTLVALLDIPGVEAALGKAGVRAEIGRSVGMTVGKQSGGLAAVALASGKTRAMVDQARDQVRANVAELIDNAIGVFAREAFTAAFDIAFAATLEASSQHAAGQA